MKSITKTIVMSMAVLAFAGRALAAGPVVHVIEPDAYAEGAVLNDVNPRVQLRIFDGVIRTNFPQDFGVFPTPSIIPVTANENVDIFGGFFTSTGTKSFGHANIDFFPESRQLAMRFLAPTTDVSIDFIGTSTLSAQVGVLQVFSPQGNLLDQFTSGPLMAHQIATLHLARPAGDIGYARAFSSPTASPFGTLDSLRFTSVPEPKAFASAMVALLLVPLAGWERRQKSHAKSPRRKET